MLAALHFPFPAGYPCNRTPLPLPWPRMLSPPSRHWPWSSSTSVQWQAQKIWPRSSKAAHAAQDNRQRNLHICYMCICSIYISIYIYICTVFATYMYSLSMQYIYIQYWSALYICLCCTYMFANHIFAICMYVFGICVCSICMCYIYIYVIIHIYIYMYSNINNQQ